MDFLKDDYVNLGGPIQKSKPAVFRARQGGGNAGLNPVDSGSSSGGIGGPLRRAAAKRAQSLHEVAGLQVSFPFTPYSCQLTFMETAINALQRGENALLESPTGTGKTLCLLCSTLAWQQTQGNNNNSGLLAAAGVKSEDARATSAWTAAAALLGLPENTPQPPSSSSNGEMGGGGHGRPTILGGGHGRPTILYASRTHSQLSQVVKEVRALAYQPHIAVLGSRQQLCIHEHVSTLPGSALNHACSSLTATRPGQCKYRNAVPDTLSSASLGGIDSGEHLMSHHHSSGRRTPPNGRRTPPNGYTSSTSSKFSSSSSSSSSSGSSTTAVAAAGESFEEEGGTVMPGFGHAEALDIEELVAVGRKQSLCPYYLSRNAVPGADLVLLPYNYLLDPSARAALKVDWNGAVVIFDEAHNLEGIASDAASAELSSFDIAGALGELDDCVRIVHGDSGGGGASGISGGNGAPPPVDLASVLILKHLLLALETEVDAVPLANPNSRGNSSNGVGRSGQWLLDLLAKHGVTCATSDLIVRELERCSDLLMDGKSLGGSSASLKLEAVVKFLRAVFRAKVPEAVQALSDRYRCFIAPMVPKRSGKGGKSNGGSSSAQSASAALNGRLLSYWCFSPGVAMEELKSMGVRSILLASGTLAPLASFAQELRLPFPHRLENPHVINASKQVFACVLGKGVSGKTLNSSYSQRDNEAYKLELGRTVATLAKKCPGGVLVFFPSYTALEAALGSWKEDHSGQVWKSLEAAKGAVLVEPRSAAGLKPCLESFRAAVARDPHKGACFFAVCRGKVSEGLDFADAQARLVILTGIPYAPAMDPKVMLKKEQLDLEVQAQAQAARYLHSASASTSTSSLAPVGQVVGLSGREWYSQQALRAVNQALGRVIRHRLDWGAVMLLDERFASKDHKQCLSAWLRPHIQSFTGQQSPSRIDASSRSNSSSTSTPSNGGGFREAMGGLTRFLRDVENDTTLTPQVTSKHAARAQNGGLAYEDADGPYVDADGDFNRSSSNQGDDGFIDDGDDLIGLSQAVTHEVAPGWTHTAPSTSSSYFPTTLSSDGSGTTKDSSAVDNARESTNASKDGDKNSFAAWKASRMKARGTEGNSGGNTASLLKERLNYAPSRSNESDESSSNNTQQAFELPRPTPLSQDTAAIVDNDATDGNDTTSQSQGTMLSNRRKSPFGLSPPLSQSPPNLSSSSSSSSQSQSQSQSQLSQRSQLHGLHPPLRGVGPPLKLTTEPVEQSGEESPPPPPLPTGLRQFQTQKSHEPLLASKPRAKGIASYFAAQGTTATNSNNNNTSNSKDSWKRSKPNESRRSPSPPPPSSVAAHPKKSGTSPPPSSSLPSQQSRAATPPEPSHNAESSSSTDGAPPRKKIKAIPLTLPNNGLSSTSSSTTSSSKPTLFTKSSVPKTTSTASKLAASFATSSSKPSSSLSQLNSNTRPPPSLSSSLPAPPLPPSSSAAPAAVPPATQKSKQAGAPEYLAKVQAALTSVNGSVSAFSVFKGAFRELRAAWADPAAGPAGESNHTAVAIVAAAESAAMEKICNLFVKKVRQPARELVAEFVSLFAPSARAPGLNRILNFCLPVLPSSTTGAPRAPSNSGNYAPQSQSQLPQSTAGANAKMFQATKRSTALAFLGKKPASTSSASTSSRPLMPPAKTPFKTNPRTSPKAGGGGQASLPPSKTTAQQSSSAFSMEDLEASELNHHRSSSEEKARHSTTLGRRPTPTAAELAAAAAAAADQPVLGWKCIICHESGISNNNNESSKANIASSSSDTGDSGANSPHHPLPVGARQPLVARCGHVACKGCWAQWKRSEANQRQVKARAAAMARSKSNGGPSSSSSSASGSSSASHNKSNDDGDDAAMLCPACQSPIPLGSLRFLVGSKKQ